MSRRWLGAAVLAHGLLLLPIQSAHSQTPRDPSRDHDLLIGLRDTVSAVQSALWEFRRDLRGVGRETVLARAAVVRAQCAAAANALKSAEPALDSAAVNARTRGAATELGRTMRALGTTLMGDCRQGFRLDGPGVWADSLRAWGPYRSSRIERAIRTYQSAANRYAGAAGFKLEPRIP